MQSSTYEGKHAHMAAMPNEGTHYSTARLIQSICNDRFSRRIWLRSCMVDRSYDENPSVLHDVRPILSQEAALEALENGTEEVVKMREQYMKRRDFIVRRFNEIGLGCHLPRGSFYAFPSVKKLGIDEVEFCHRLLREEEVAVVPGSAFGDHGQNIFEPAFQHPIKDWLKPWIALIDLSINSVGELKRKRFNLCF